MGRFRLGLLTGLLAWVLSGCVMAPPAREGCGRLHDAAYLDRLNHQSQWTLRGRVVWQHALKARMQSATLFWQQKNQQDYVIRLLGPIGVGGGRLTRENKQVTWRVGQKQWVASSADQLVQENLGMRLPVERLTDWVRGLPGKRVGETIIYNQQGRLQQVRGSGFVVDVSGYHCVKGNWVLPTHLEIRFDRQTVRLDITAWDIADRL